MTTIGSLFGKEVYIRLSGGEEFICTTRFAGFRVSTRRFAVSEKPGVPAKVEEREPGQVVRRETRREYEE